MGGIFLLVKLHQGIATLVVGGVDQGLDVGNQVAHSHARHEGIAQGLSHVAAQGDGVGKLGPEFEQGDDIAPTNLALQASAVQRHFFHAARRIGVGFVVGLNAFNQHPAGVGDGGYANAIGQQLAQGFVGRGQLVNSRLVNGAQHGGTGASGGNDDDVTRQQAHIGLGAAFMNKLVKVECGDGFGVALELNVAHAAGGRGAAGFKQSTHQGRQAGQGVGPWATGLPHHKDLQRAQLAQAHGELKIVVDLAHLGFEGGVQVSGLEARDGKGADLGNTHLTVAVHQQAQVGVNGAPDAEQNFVPRANNVVRRHGHILHRGEVGGVKEVVAIKRETLARGFFNKVLEFGFFEGREWLVLAVVVEPLLV